jgi:hypothetical protein
LSPSIDTTLFVSQLESVCVQYFILIDDHTGSYVLHIIRLPCNRIAWYTRQEYSKKYFEPHQTTCCLSWYTWCKYLVTAYYGKYCGHYNWSIEDLQIGICEVAFSPSRPPVFNNDFISKIEWLFLHNLYTFTNTYKIDLNDFDSLTVWVFFYIRMSEPQIYGTGFFPVTIAW